MGDFDQFTVDDLHEIVHADKLGTMHTQAEAWQGMASMFETQLARLDTAVKGLQQAWNSPAGQKFLDEVAKVRKTLDLAQQKASSNHQAWSAIATEAGKTQTTITGIQNEYHAAWGKAQQTFQTQKKQDNDNINWAWGGLGDLWDDPKPPDQNAVRKPFDDRARAAMQTADGVYTQQYYQNLWWPPEYQGPTDALVTSNQPGGGFRPGGGSVPGGGTPPTIPPGAPPPGSHPPPGSPPPGSVPPPIKPPDGGLVWQPPPSVPLPVPTPLPPPGGTLPPPNPLPPGVPLPPGIPVPPMPGRPGLPPPRLPGGSRPPLVPEIPEPSPIVGRTVPGGRPPGVGPGREPVIGGRRPPVAPGEPIEGRGPMPGGRGGIRPISEEVIGGRGAPRPGVGEPVGRGLGRPGSLRPGAAGPDGVVRPGSGRGSARFSETAEGRAGSGRFQSGRTREGVDESGKRTGRPGRTGETGEGARRAGRTSEATSGRGLAGRRRSNESDETLEVTDLLEDGLFNVDGAVPAVIEPVGPAGPDEQRPGPHVGGAPRRR